MSEVQKSPAPTNGCGAKTTAHAAHEANNAAHPIFKQPCTFDNLTSTNVNAWTSRGWLLSFPDGSRKFVTAPSFVDALVAHGIQFECEEMFSRPSPPAPTNLAPLTRDERIQAEEMARMLAGKDARVIRKLLVAHDAMPSHRNDSIKAARVSMNLAQVKQVIEFLGDDTDGDVTIAISNDGHSGPGLYIWNEDHPEEGASFLNPDAPPQLRTD